MRALMLLPTDSLGGAENVLKMTAAQFCAASADNTLHVVFMSRGDRGHWSDLRNRATLHFIDADRESTGLFGTVLLIARLSRLGFDIAIASHTHCNGLLGTLRRLKLLRTRKLIGRESTLIGERFTGLKKLLFRSIYNWCYGPIDVVVCQTPKMRDALFRFIPKLRRKAIVVLPNPVDVERTRALAAQAAAVSVAGEYIVAIGRLVPAKGFDLLLRAFALAMRERPALSLVIVGEGQQRATLQQLALELGISERVIMPGHLKNPFPLAHGARFAVISSRMEGFPNVALEMVAVGVPVVSTNCTDGLDQLPNVVLCATENVTELADALSAMYLRVPYFTTFDAAACLDRRSPRRFLDDLFVHAGLVSSARQDQAGTATPC